MSQPPAPPPYRPTPPSEPYGPPPDGGRPRGLIVAVVIGALVVVAGSVAGAILLLGGDGGGDDDDDAARAVDPAAGPSSAPTSERSDPIELTDPTAPSSEPSAPPSSAPTNSTGSPQATADAFVAAVRLQDCATIDALTTDAFRASNDCATELRMPPGVAWELGQPEIFAQGGDSAMARVVLVIEGSEVPITSRLVNVDSAWLVDSLDLSDFPTDLPQH